MPDQHGGKLMPDQHGGSFYTPPPIGTILTRRVMMKTCTKMVTERGKLDIVTPETTWPSIHHSRGPVVGTLIVRLLKVDGSTGRKWDLYYRWRGSTQIPQWQKETC